MQNRRGFLSGLTRLPLIDGAVKLVGVPSAVAEPVTLRLLSEYETWLGLEHHRVARELRPGAESAGWNLYGSAFAWHRVQHRTDPPSTRAALVLSAVGCEWKRDG